MSADGTALEGATSHLGEVLTGNGEEVHDGLVVVDGAAVPTALGVNPFATITALAERAVEGVARRKGITIDYTTANGTKASDNKQRLTDANSMSGPIDPCNMPAYSPTDDHLDELAAIKAAEVEIDDARAAGKAGTLFTEVMRGFIHIGDEIDDFEVAADHAEMYCEDAHFYLSVHAWDTNERKFSAPPCRKTTFLTLLQLSAVQTIRPCSRAPSPMAWRVLLSWCLAVFSTSSIEIRLLLTRRISPMSSTWKV